MSLPDPERLPPLEILTGYEAVELFVDRARAVKPEFALSERNAPAIAEICWRLDGLPLAIELAAARVRLLGPEEMLERLRKGLALLAGGARDLPARQQTLRGAIAWSYDLLDEPLRAFFRRLGIFVGGWSFVAVDEICNPEGELGVDTFAALEALAENSLIRSVETDRGTTRFRMLQTIREFALESLVGDEMFSISRRHADFFLAFVEQRVDAFTKDRDAVEDTSLEHDNIRAVLRWAIDNADTDVALRLASCLWRFWMLNSHLAEGRRWLTDALALPGATERNSLRAKALMSLGSITYWQNDFEATRRHYLEGLEIFRDLGDRAALGEALYNVGFLHLIERDPQNARPYYEESRQIAEELGDEPGLARTAWALAMSALQERDWDEAAVRARETVDRFTALDDWFGISLGKFVFYQIARLTEDYREARRLMLETLEEGESRADEPSVHSVFESLAGLEAAQGRHVRALKLGGVAAAFKESYGGGAPPALIDIVDPRESAHGHLDEARISELWEEGRAMPLEEALALARKDPDAD
jgi:tetratricopeptide (TPR) repeat protein